MRLSNGDVLLHYPLDLHVLTQGWYYNNGSLHQAADWRTQNGTDYKRPVYAAEDGTVSATQLWDGHTTDERSMQSYGNYVDIRHADYRQQSLITRYAHLFKFIVCKGEKVKEGQTIEKNTVIEKKVPQKNNLTTSRKAVKTGDTSNLLMYSVIGLVGGLIFLIAGIILLNNSRKTRQHREGEN